MTLSMTPERRAFLARIGSLGGLTAAVSVDTEARAKTAQGKFRQGFQFGHGCSACPRIENPTGDQDNAERLYRMHFKRIRMARR